MNKELMHVDFDAPPSKLSEADMVRIAAEIRAVAMTAGSPGEAFAMLLATVSAFIADTDCPLALIQTAIESLSDDRAALEIKLARVGRAIADLPDPPPPAEWQSRVWAEIDKDKPS